MELTTLRNFPVFQFYIFHKAIKPTLPNLSQSNILQMLGHNSQIIVSMPIGQKSILSVIPHNKNPCLERIAVM